MAYDAAGLKNSGDEVTPFLSALFAASGDPINLCAGDAEELVTTAAEIAAFTAKAGEAPIYVRPTTATGRVAFLHTVIENSSANEWESLNLRPTVVLFKDGLTLACYGLEAPAESSTEIAALFAAMGGDVTDAIPTPGANGWAVVHCAPEDFQPLGALLEAYSDAPPAPVEESAPAIADYGTLNQARILAPIDLEAPELQREMVISRGANFKSVKWKPDRMTIRRFVEIMATHPEGRQKDGPGFVLGEIVGDNRRKQAVTACYGVGLDVDVGTSGRVIDAALAELGCLAVRYTTFSHGKTTSKFNKDKITKWVAKQGIPFDEAGVIRFLREATKWDEGLLATASYTGDSHEPEGFVANISHAPMEKHRIVMPLAEPFDPTKVAETHAEGMAKWAAVCKALARALGDLPMDNSAVDPSRLFYFPRHPKGKPHETTVFGGPLLDWRSLDLEGAGPVGGDVAEDAFDKALAAETGGGKRSKSRSTTDEGKALGRWSSDHAEGFQIVDVIRAYAEDRVRSHGADKIDLECPFDEDHSNPGDAEDRGCFAVNAGADRSPIFVIKCQHDSCQGRTPLDFLGKMLADDWFGEEVLEDPSYNAEVADDAQAEAEAADVVAEIQQDIEALEKSDHAGRRAISKRIAEEVSDDADEEGLLTALWRRSGVKKRVLANEVRALRPASASDRTPRDGQVVTLPDGHRVLMYVDQPDHLDACQFLVNTMRLQNRQYPIWTFNLGISKLERREGRVSFVPLREREFTAKIARACSFAEVVGDGEKMKREKPTKGDAISTVFNDPDDLPPQPRLLGTPTVAPTGEVLHSDGFHPAANVYLDLGGLKVPSVPDHPTVEDRKDARALLLDDLLIDFPFRDLTPEGFTREPSQANAVAMLLTPFMRALFHGPAPIFGITKPRTGTGATLLAEVFSVILDGVRGAPFQYPKSEDELQKRLIAIARSSVTHVLFDNVTDFNSNTLKQTITAEKIGGRVLGLSDMVERKNDITWLLTANNPNLDPEMTRRTAWIRLNALRADNQVRKFHHPDLLAWVGENRGKLIGALLTLIRAWIDASKPAFTGEKLASFESWAAAVGGVLDHAEIKGFLTNRKAPTEDRDDIDLQDFAKVWAVQFGDGWRTEADVYGWAVIAADGLVRGYDEAEKKASLASLLERLREQVFEVEKQLLMFEGKAGEWRLAPPPSDQGAEG